MLNRGKITKPNIVCAERRQYRWFRARAVPIRDQAGKVKRWYGTCSDIHDSKLLEQSIRESAVELEKMVDERTTALRRLSSRLMTMQDEERRRIARELHDGLGQEMVALKMVLSNITQQDPEPMKDRVAEASRHRSCHSADSNHVSSLASAAAR